MHKENSSNLYPVLLIEINKLTENTIRLSIGVIHKRRPLRGRVGVSSKGDLEYKPL